MKSKTKSNCEIEQCALHQIIPEDTKEVKNSQYKGQNEINNIEFDLINNGMTKTKDNNWINRPYTDSEQIGEDISSPSFGYRLSDLKLLPKPNQTTELKDLPMEKGCRLKSSTLNPHIPI